MEILRDDNDWSRFAESVRRRLSRSRVVLEGETAGDGGIGRPVILIVSRPRNGALHGGISIYYAGRPISAEINLRSTPQAP